MSKFTLFCREAIFVASLRTFECKIFWSLRHLTREMERHEKIHFDKYNLTNTIWKMHFERLLTFRTKTKTKTISETCGIWDTHNNSGNWETEFLKIFVTWQWQWQTKTKTKTKNFEKIEKYFLQLHFHREKLLHI